MKLARPNISAALNLSLVFVSFLIFSSQSISAQDSKIALQRGYRTGYSDGYMAGYRDSMENAGRSFARHTEYTRADRAYANEYGSLQDYRDGYQQGFESGYNTGFDRLSFDAILPANLERRGTINTGAATVSQPATTTTSTTTTTNGAPVLQTKQTPAEILASGEQIIIIPKDTELILELIGDISSQNSKAGDKFQAKVVSPTEIAGAIVDGHITKVTKPGHIKRRSQIQLTFDKISLSNTRWSNFSAILTEVLPIKGDNVKKVDIEGTVTGKSSIKSDSIKVGAATATGAGVGAIVGGPVGAAVGAGVGAAFGVGAVVVERGKHIKLIEGHQMRIKTGLETQIR